MLETPKRKRITSRPLSLYTNFVGCFDLAKKGISDCLKYHAACPSKCDAELPTRVLDLGLPENSDSDLHLRATGQQQGAWVMLSHCSGKSTENRYTTTAANLDERMSGIRFTDLPQTFQDAVVVTPTLGYCYLWIDSLCILQDDHADSVIELS